MSTSNNAVSRLSEGVLDPPENLAIFTMASPAFLALSHTLVVRDNNGNSTDGKSQELWDKQGRYPYDPNFAAACIFVAIYALTLLINVFQYFWYRSWFWWPMLLAALSASPLASLLSDCANLCLLQWKQSAS